VARLCRCLGAFPLRLVGQLLRLQLARIQSLAILALAESAELLVGIYAGYPSDRLVRLRLESASLLVLRCWHYQQVYDLAHSVPNISEAEAEQMDWAPLGVFAAMRQNEADSQRAMQLAVNRNGVLTGTYMNRSNGHVHPLSGMVDERTQRAAWAFADGQQKKVVFETGIYNLTRDEASIMVHFWPSADDTEVWQLVRLEQPESSGDNAATPQSAAPQALP
jgi:hypothetical protein